MIDVLQFLPFAAFGITAGALAGLFGIGGGMVIVPGLFYLFTVIHLPEDALIHMAAGTSMCIMIFTSAASIWSHQRNGNVQWAIFRKVFIAIMVGVVFGNLLSSSLNSKWLELIFGVFLVVVSLKILLNWSPGVGEAFTSKRWLTNLIGLVIGFKSGILGIGGGALSVPFLLHCGLPVNKASATSASFTFPIAIVGTLSFFLLTRDQTITPWSTGYIYWPAVALVAPFSMMGAPIGAKLSQIIPAQKLRTLFTIFLMGVGFKMLGGTVQFF